MQTKYIVILTSPVSETDDYVRIIGIYESASDALDIAWRGHKLCSEPSKHATTQEYHDFSHALRSNGKTSIMFKGYETEHMTRITVQRVDINEPSFDMV